MKAYRYTQYGSPAVLQLKDMPKPEPAEDQVLIKIMAAATNPLDWHMMRADPFIVRMSMGWLAPKSEMGIGADFAGIVEAVGNNVTEFQAGDEVYGSSGTGAFAEYICITEKRIVKKPKNISYEEAAAIPIVLFTALQALRDTAKIQAGEKVLINGASGGVGSMAVQLAKYYGAEVTAVCSSRNASLVKSLGADKVIPYDQADFTKSDEKYDLVFCAMGNRWVWDYRRALKPNGRSVNVGFANLLRSMVYMVVGSQLSKNSPKKSLSLGMAKTSKDDLLYINPLLESGAIKAVIDKCYPFEQTREAIAYLETGRARGKVIVSPIQAR